MEPGRRRSPFVVPAHCMTRLWATPCMRPTGCVPCPIPAIGRSIRLTFLSSEQAGAPPLETPWLLSFITCAAPYAPHVGQPASGDLLKKRIHRVLSISHAHGHATLVLGACGCGAFGNDPLRTAVDFRAALEGPFAGCFKEVVFAITDWSPERRFLGPFREVFSQVAH